jgi:hypothetical protein
MFGHFMRVLDTDYNRREATSCLCYGWRANAVCYPIAAEKFHATVPLKQPGIEAPFL